MKLYRNVWLTILSVLLLMPSFEVGADDSLYNRVVGSLQSEWKLGDPPLGNLPVLCEQYGRTNVEVVLTNLVQRGLDVLPKIEAARIATSNVVMIPGERDIMQSVHRVNMQLYNLEAVRDLGSSALDVMGQLQSRDRIPLLTEVAGMTNAPYRYREMAVWSLVRIGVTNMMPLARRILLTDRGKFELIQFARTIAALGEELKNEKCDMTMRNEIRQLLTESAVIETNRIRLGAIDEPLSKGDEVYRKSAEREVILNRFVDDEYFAKELDALRKLPADQRTHLRATKPEMK